VLHTIVEGEPGIFPDPVARIMRGIGGLFRRRPTADDAAPSDPPKADDVAPPGRPEDSVGGSHDSTADDAGGSDDRPGHSGGDSR